MAGLTDKVILITGASEGIGRALALALAPLGCKLVLSARNESRLLSLAHEVASQGHDPCVFVVSEIHKRALDSNGRPLGDATMPESKRLTAQECAKMMVPVISSRGRLLITSMRGRLGRLLKLFAPRLIDKIAKRAIASGH